MAFTVHLSMAVKYRRNQELQLDSIPRDLRYPLRGDRGIKFEGLVRVSERLKERDVISCKLSGDQLEAPLTRTSTADQFAAFRNQQPQDWQASNTPRRSSTPAFRRIL
jgi:hypothetical protein